MITEPTRTAAGLTSCHPQVWSPSLENARNATQLIVSTANADSETRQLYTNTE
jgi:hypothetical protein